MSVVIVKLVQNRSSTEKQACIRTEWCIMGEGSGECSLILVPCHKADSVVEFVDKKESKDSILNSLDV